MLTEREQKVVNWLMKTKVATMRHLRHQFKLSHMTVIRALKKHGYYTSYNHNASYYVLQDLPAFNEWGLWAYRSVRFSQHGTLTQTIVALVENAPAGLTVTELEERLEVKVANLASRLVHDGIVQRERLPGRQAVYLASDTKVGSRQYEKRRKQLQPPPRGSAQLPEACAPAEVIEILRQMVIARDVSADQLARQLKNRGVPITVGKVRRVIEHYALEKKRRSTRSRG
jgi:hypothetical protein